MSNDAAAFADTIVADLSRMDDMEEETILGERRYELQGPLGEGGMGRVLVAKDLQFSRSVALKYLRRQLIEPGMRRRFRQEAIVTANLEHPGVPTVYERGVSKSGAPFYAMKLVRGRTLTDAIGRAQTLADRLKLIPVVVRVAQTLGFAHSRGVIHRDIKPDNIVIGGHGETVVLDWGISKLRGVPDDVSAALAPSAESASTGNDATRHGSLLGTPTHMAPEQASGNIAAIDERTDVFALGALLYHLLTGEGPYAGDDVARVVERAKKADFAPVAALAPAVPVGLRAICERAMARQPEDRYPTAVELAEALEEFSARSFADDGSLALRAFAAIVSTAALVAFVYMLARVFAVVSSSEQQGTFTLIVPALAAAGCTLSAIEWVTRGRYSLSTLSFGLMLAVFLGGVGWTVANVEVVLTAMSSERILADATLYRSLATRGLFEALGLLANASLLAAVQALLWGIARRRVTSERTPLPG